MEIQNKSAQTASQSTQPSQGVVNRQEVPGNGSKLPSVEIKAPPKVPEYDVSDLDKAVQDLQQYVKDLGRNLSFTRDEALNRDVITVRDRETDEVVRQIPGEEVLAISRQIKADLDELRAGMLLKGQV